MTQRASTLTVAGVLLTILVSVAFLVPVPYVLESPGLTADTLGSDISAAGRPTDQDVISFGSEVQTYPTEGELRLTTAQVTRADSKVTLFQALGAWFDPEDALIPRDVVYPPEQSAQEAQDLTRVAMTGSQETSEVAGVRAAGYDVEEYVLVAGVVVDGPSDGVLEPGDRILAVDGDPVADSDAVVTVVRSREPGDTIAVTVLRAGEPRTVDITAEETDDDVDGPRTSIGITVGPGFDVPVDVTFNLERSIGGPSAGSMFALAIYDKLTPGSLTGGEVVGMPDERVVVEATSRVLRDEQVGPEPPDLAGDVSPQLQRRGEVAVGIAEVHDLGDAQDVGRRALLGQAGRRELLWRHLEVFRALAAVGGDHVVDAGTGLRQVRDSGTGTELGIVRMADDDEDALDGADQLVALDGAHRLMLPGRSRAHFDRLRPIGAYSTPVWPTNNRPPTSDTLTRRTAATSSRGCAASRDRPAGSSASWRRRRTASTCSSRSRR